MVQSEDNVTMRCQFEAVSRIASGLAAEAMAEDYWNQFFVPFRADFGILDCLNFDLIKIQHWPMAFAQVLIGVRREAVPHPLGHLAPFDCLPFAEEHVGQERLLRGLTGSFPLAFLYWVIR